MSLLLHDNGDAIYGEDKKVLLLAVVNEGRFELEQLYRRQCQPPQTMVTVNRGGVYTHSAGTQTINNYDGQPPDAVTGGLPPDAQMSNQCVGNLPLSKVLLSVVIMIVAISIIIVVLAVFVSFYFYFLKSSVCSIGPFAGRVCLCVSSLDTDMYVHIYSDVYLFFNL